MFPCTSAAQSPGWYCQLVQHFLFSFLLAGLLALGLFLLQFYIYYFFADSLFFVISWLFFFHGEAHVPESVYVCIRVCVCVYICPSPCYLSYFPPSVCPGL